MKNRALLLLTLLFLGLVTANGQDNRILTFQEAKALAEKGDAYGEAVVAFHYSVGWQTEKNLELAANFAMSSAQKGHPLGIFRLGALRRTGEGIEKNEEQGLALQKKAFNGLNDMSGNPYAMTALGVMLFQGKVVPENKKEAARLYKIAADMGFAPAQFNYAMCAEAGHGTTKSKEICDDYIFQANSKNYPSADIYLQDNFIKLSIRGYDLNESKGSQNEIKPIVQEAPISIWSVDISKNQRLIAVQTATKVIIYESDSGRLLSSFISRNSDIAFRSSSETTLVQIDRGSKQVHLLDITTGQSEPLRLNTKGTPIAYSPYDDSIISITLFRKGLKGEVFKTSINSGKTVSIGVFNSKAGVCGEGYYDLHALARKDGSLALVNFFNDAWEGFKPINCFLEYINGEWIASYDENAVNETIRFLKLPMPENELKKDIFDNSLYQLEKATIPLDKMLWLSGKPDILILDDSPLKHVSIVTPSGRLNSSIMIPVARIVDGITASWDGSKLLIWNLDESWVKSKLVPDWENFGFNGQKEAMGMPPALANFSEFTYTDVPLGDYVVWSSILSNDGEKVAFVATRKKNTNQDFVTEKRLLSNALLFDLSSRIKIESNNSAELFPLDMNDGQYSVWIGDKISIDFADNQFSGNPSQWLVTKDETIKYLGNNQKAASNNKSVVKNFKFGNSISVKNLTGWDMNGKYVFSSIVTISEENNQNLPRLFFDAKVESAFPIDADKYLIHNGNTFLIFDTSARKVVSSLYSGYLDSRIKNIALCPEENHFWYKDPSGYSLRRVDWDAKGSLTESLRMYPKLQGYPLYISREGYYASISSGDFGVHFSDWKKTYPFEQFDLRLNRPDIVLERLGAPEEAITIAKQLREKRLKRMGVTEDMLQPDFHLPEIEIVGDLPSSTVESELALKIKASDSKYPLDRLRVYVNNVPVNGKEGQLLRDAKSQNLERTIPIKLAAGRNKIQVSVLNSAGAESLYANAEVTCTAQRPKPTLYAVAMGVSEYANPEWNLKYAAKDARDILERLKARSGSSYGEIKELLLTDRDVSKDSLGKIREFLSPATVDDTVMMFVAGHGLLDSKYDYYFGTADIDFNNPSGNGIAFEEFDDLLAELPCLRKSLLIDTCHAGELDEDEKKMLASAQANSNQVVAMLPAGARGMTIKPIEGARGKSEWYDRLQGLFVDLRRGSGSTILSSSAGAEYALESSEQKNGLFTYAVLEALDGKEGADANKDGSVSISELAEYVKSRVATLTNNKQSPNVRRVNLEADFALTKK